ncbi:alkaline phosphatase D family protein [Roseateles sp. SL47]|uniref:alkaline phosphatase D family protein n=1 Tax=Roseateles sp. SL47 TaxID=2995138 RepID=UPI00226E2999|nr:alkaline phosphatase D family protein [Roseateles sp. SL47]WAC73582.1 alkaline phosphatase D family protein [Roseateles sp. SL47]
MTRRQLMVAGSLAAGPLAAVGQALAGPATSAAPQPGSGAADPAAVPPKRMRIAFGSCARQTKPQPIWQAIGAAQPDLFIFLGDNLYADARDEATLRQRYAEFMAVEPLQAFRRQTPHIAIWDDHDYGDDDEGGDYPLKRLSQQLFCDAWQEPADSPRRRQAGVYASYRYEVAGRRVQVILPDLRFNRSALTTDPKLKSSYGAMVLRAKLSGQPMTGWYVPDPSPTATMLGEAQWQWLEACLREPADVRLIGSSVQFAAEGSGWECWANFPHERERLTRLIQETGAEGVVFISGDMHYAEMSRLEVPGAYPLWDATSSGLTEVWNIPTPNRNRRSEVIAACNFGLLDIEASGDDTLLRFSLCDAQGVPKVTQTVAVSTLRLPAGKTAEMAAPTAAASGASGASS